MVKVSQQFKNNKDEISVPLAVGFKGLLFGALVVVNGAEDEINVPIALGAFRDKSLLMLNKTREFKFTLP